MATNIHTSRRVRKVDMNEYEIIETLKDGPIVLLSVRHKDSRMEGIMRIDHTHPLNEEEQERFMHTMKDVEEFIDTYIQNFPDYQYTFLPIADYGVDEQQLCSLVFYAYTVSDAHYHTLQEELVSLSPKYVSLPIAFEWVKVLGHALEVGYERGKLLTINRDTILIKKASLNDTGVPCLLCIMDNGDIDLETAHFLSPEHFDEETSKKLGPQSMVYTLATLFCLLASGKLPLQGKNVPSLISQHKSKQPTFSKKIPRPLQKVLEVALAKEVEDRYETIKQFLEALALAYQSYRRNRRRRQSRNKAISLPAVPITFPAISRRDAIAALVAVIVAGGAAAAVFTVEHERYTPPKKVTNEHHAPKQEAFGLVTSYTHNTGVNRVGSSSNSEWLASGDDSGFVKLFSLKNMLPALLLPKHHEHGIADLVWSPALYQEHYLATIDYDGLLYIRTLKGEVITHYKFDGSNFALAWAGQHLLVAVDNIVRSFDDVIKNQFRREEPYAYKYHTDTVNAIACIPGTSTLVATVSDDKTLQVWDVEHADQRLYAFPRYAQPFISVDWSPDAQSIAISSEDGSVLFIAAPPLENMGEIRRAYNQLNGPINSVSWNHSSQRLALGRDDSTVIILDLYGQTIKQIQVKGSNNSAVSDGSNNAIQSVAFTQDGMYLVVGSSGRVVEIHHAF